MIAYNLLNEPAPERPSGYESGTTQDNIAWYEKQNDTARDLPALSDVPRKPLVIFEAMQGLHKTGGSPTSIFPIADTKQMPL